MRPETHLVIGPWCLDGVWDEVPPFERFDAGPDPLARPEAQDAAAAQARRLVARLAGRLAGRFNRERGLDLPAAFWDAALAPWLCTAAEVLVERILRLEALIRRYGREPLRVPLRPYGDGRFKDIGDFMRHGVLCPVWNHALLSALLEPRLPPTWRAEPAASEPVGPAPRSASRQDGRERLRRLVRHAAFALPFPPIKGFGFGQVLLFSLVLLLNRRRENRTLPLAAWKSEPCPPFPLGLDEAEAERLILPMLPLSLREARLPRRARPAAIRTRVLSTAALDDDAYRLRTALAAAGGCRTAFIQHGGDYGYVRNAVAFPLAEYSRHAFFSWGPRRHGNLPGNLVPLPHAGLARLRGKHRESAPVLLFTGTETALLPYTLKSMPRPEAQFRYRDDKARFLKALPEGLRRQTLYRPYFDVPCSLEDAPWVLRRFPEVRRCIGPLEPQLLGCRLLVLDHLGTTLAQALSAGVPLVLFWRRDIRHYTADAETLLDGLRHAGVLCDTPEAAAAQVAAVWDNPIAWRDVPAVRAACAAWAHAFMRTVEGNETPLWIRALRDL